MHRLKMKLVIPMIMAVFLLMTALSLIYLEYRYSQMHFEQISDICQLLTTTVPEAEQPLLDTLKQYQFDSVQRVKEEQFLLQHGYKRSDFEIKGQEKFWMMSVVFLVLGSSMLIYVFLILKKQQRSRIEELTLYLEKVNLYGNGAITQDKEDDFSLLQDEIYKTVTTLYQTKEIALKAKENYKENLANIAHQLKTSITAASLYLQLLKGKGELVYLDQAQNQLKRLNDLEEGLLMISRIDSGTLELQCELIDIYTALNLAAENLENLLSAKNVTVHIPEDGCVTILGDMDWTMEAIINLMKNCMEYTSENGVIYCNYTSNPLYTEILIWDEGEGFAKEDIPHLFERFYRGKNTSKSGIGIGLALAKSIIEMENGTIAAKNIPHGGACFEIRFYSH